MMKKKRRLVRQDNAGKAGKKIKGHFREIQEEMINEKILEAKKKRALELKGNSYNASSPPDEIEGLPGHIPFSSGLPAVEGLEDVLPQRIADDAFESVAQAKEENYGSFRGDIKESMKDAASFLKGMLSKLQDDLLLIKNNDPKWTDLGIEKKVRILASLSESMVKINHVELSWAKPESKKGQPQVHLHYNIPDDPGERMRLLNEYDGILGRKMRDEVVIPAIPSGFQQRVLIETKPVEIERRNDAKKEENRERLLSQNIQNDK